MTNSPSTSALLAATLLLCAAPAMARPPASAIRVVHPWIRPTPPNAPSAAAYLAITNTGPRPDRLLGASSPRAAKVELHAMSMAGGVMRMRPVDGGLEAPPGKTVTLGAGGLHLMLVQPKGPLKLGEHVPVVLRFQNAGAVPTTFTVEAAPAGGMEMH